MAAAALLSVLLAAPAAAHPGDKADLQASLLTIEGTVANLFTLIGEGDLEVVAAELDAAGPGAAPVTIVLAPPSVMQRIPYVIELDDLVRARVFVDEAGPLKVHAVDNLTRHTAVRLRTLHKYPLWDAEGNWSGGPCRQRQRRRGPRHGN